VDSNKELHGTGNTNTEEVKLVALRTALSERSEKSNPSLRSNNTYIERGEERKRNTLSTARRVTQPITTT